MSPIATNASTGRFPDGADTGSNCTDFLTQAAAALAASSSADASNIKVTSVEGFGPGQTILIESGANLETAIIATVGTAGATTVRTATDIGATVLPVASTAGFSRDQTITIDSGENAETSAVSAIRNYGGAARLILTAPLTRAHAAGVPVSGTGISLTTALTRAHAAGAQVTSNLPTPGVPNQYQKEE